MEFENTKEGLQCIVPIADLASIGIQDSNDLHNPNVLKELIGYIMYNATIAGMDTQKFNGKLLRINVSVNTVKQNVTFMIAPVKPDENEDENYEEHSETDSIDESKEFVTLCCEFSNLNNIFSSCNAIANVNTNVELFKYKDDYYMILTVDTKIANRLYTVLSEFCSTTTNALKATLIKEHGKPMGRHLIQSLANLA